MLDNEITLAVDTANTGVTTDVVYSRYDSYQNRSVFISDTHQPDNRDLLTFSRTFPKVAGTFRGVRKTSVKFTEDCEVSTNDGGTTLSSQIAEVKFSIPVGVPTAAIIAFRQKVVALLDDDDVMSPLNDLQMI